MIAKVLSVALTGIDGALIEVETDMKQGLPGIQIVGMGNKAVNEAKERIRSAIRHSLLEVPARKFTINLAPAALPKDGSHFDLALAVSLLVATGQLRQTEVDNALFAGELSLDGTLKPVRGAVTIAEATKAAEVRSLFIPAAQASQAALIDGVSVYGVATLKEVFLHLKGIALLLPAERPRVPHPPLLDFSFDDIIGQETAKRALQITIAGHHNLLIIGPPGAGKTLLAQAAKSLLPPLSLEEQIAVTKIQGLSSQPTSVITAHRPFRSPHHSTSMSALIGGGAKLYPGEITRAHLGILYLDELPEFSPNVLEALRQPLESRNIQLSRLNTHHTYPADFILIATMNPCPCGYYGDAQQTCRCSAPKRQQYRRRLSGPLLDRIDIIIHVSRLEIELLQRTNMLHKRQHSKVLKSVVESISVQHTRYNSSYKCNGYLTPRETSVFLNVEKTAEKLLQTAAKKLHLTARSYFKILKVAQTIADLEAARTITNAHVSEALQLRVSLSEM